MTDYPPDADGGGAVILRSLLGPEERRSVLWLSPSPASDGSLTLRSGSAGRGRRSLLKDQTIHARALATEVRRIARDRGAAGAWVVMHGAGVGIARRLADRGGLPLHLSVHDDPAFANALRSRRYLALAPGIARDLGRAIRRARSVDVIGGAMAEAYRAKYGVEAAVVHRALPGPVEPAPDYDRGRHGLRVGVLGSTYAYRPLRMLARAVAEGSRALGVPGRVRVIGRSHGDRLRSEMGGEVEVEVTGHVEEGRGVELLRECFALDLNYPFGPLDGALRRLSFPTKLGTYALAARPLLIHAPADSSTLALLGVPGYARHWGDDRPATGAAILADLWRQAGSGASRHEAAEAVRLRYFDPDANRRALFGALDALVAP